MKTRSDSFRSFLILPQAWHVLDEGYHMLTILISIPFSSHFCFSLFLNSWNFCDATDFDKCLFFIIPDTFRSSTVIYEGLVFTIAFTVLLT